MSDRTVHGLTNLGNEVVRYDRAGKWYIEPGTDPRGLPQKRESITVFTAARLLAAGQWFGVLPGGQQVAAMVRRLTKETTDA